MSSSTVVSSAPAQRKVISAARAELCIENTKRPAVNAKTLTMLRPFMCSSLGEAEAVQQLLQCERQQVAQQSLFDTSQKLMPWIKEPGSTHGFADRNPSTAKFSSAIRRS